MNISDATLIEKLRKENLEQFFTLVRMHLSFLVDIQTDDVDSSADKPKQFRWNFHRKTKSSAPSSSHSNTNSSKNVPEVNSITEEGISRAYELIDFLSIPENVAQEGIFRRTGSLSRQQELRQLLLTGTSLGLDESRFSVHDCASVLKGFLAELPQPLLMDQYYQTYCTLASQYPPNVDTSETKLLTALQLLLLLLTPLHRNFLQRLLSLLKTAADNESTNRMSPDTLATMFTPHLLCPRKLSPETFHTDAIALAPLISFMIRHSENLFCAPEQLVTDVSAYFTIRERKKMLSPDIDLDESITDRTAASTVYTFVDRGRTRAENSRNPTDTALAQLYAHIQALPESQHKRRLVKQFNRQNGYGTPIQVQRTGKAAGSRSFGDSIKRHIFQKGLLNKTPKKGSATAINTVEQKLLSKEKLRFSNEDTKDVSHKTVVLKNLANKMASSESLDNDEYESDASNESTLSDGALSQSKKRSPKFVSEPNLSVLDTRMDEETPKNTKKRGPRLFRSKVLSASQNLNKKYQKRATVIRGTPTCVSCFDEPDTASDNDISAGKHVEDKQEPSTPKCKAVGEGSRMHYITSTPGMAEVYNEECPTPYTFNFRRASMSPITKSTQKLSKAMQESIMTPRSRKPLIITSEQRDLPENVNKPAEVSKASDTMYQSMSPKNDSDFVSSEDDMMSHSSQMSCDISNGLRPAATRFVISHERPTLSQDLNNTLCGDEMLPKFKISHEVSGKCLSEPFRDYLHSRSVLTATPVDLSILNKSCDLTDDRISESLMYCLDGNVPSDLTSSINNLVVDRSDAAVSRSPLKSINNFVIIEASKSPSRKRSKGDEPMEVETKRTMMEKENIVNSEGSFELRETDL